MKSTLERARAYVAAMPPAVSGDGGHAAAFAVAKALCHDFGLSLSDARTLFEEYNVRCDPPWSAREIAHKLESASRLTSAKRARGELREPIPAPVFRPSARLGTLGTLKINSRPPSRVGTLGTVFCQSSVYRENIHSKLFPHTELSEKEVSQPSQIGVFLAGKESGAANPVLPVSVVAVGLPAPVTLEGVETAPESPQPPPGRALLIPLEAPWIDGARYAKAFCTEWPSRLDLYLLDPKGDTRRSGGALIALSHPV